jgi:hypothetical protein
MTLRQRRRRVRRLLRRLRERIERLIGAERNRDAVTAKRKRVYRNTRDRLGDNHPDTRLALRRFRESRALSVQIDETQAVLRQRAENKLEWLKDHPLPPGDFDHDGIIVVDGVPLARGVAKEVLRIRDAGRWKGRCVSGFRTPAHSISLCMGMCGAPSCPGKCAGAASRHAHKPPQQDERSGAVDLTDFITFAQECARLDSWLENHLPNDLVHFSDIGN